MPTFTSQQTDESVSVSWRTIELLYQGPATNRRWPRCDALRIEPWRAASRVAGAEVPITVNHPQGGGFPSPAWHSQMTVLPADDCTAFAEYVAHLGDAEPPPGAPAVTLADDLRAAIVRVFSHGPVEVS